MNRTRLFRALGVPVVGLAAASSFAAIAEDGGKLALSKPEDPWSSPPWNLIAVIDDVDQPAPRNVTQPPDYIIDASPSWSPNGKQLAFNRTDMEQASNAIYRINADGSGLTQLVSSVDDYYGAPQWGPRNANLIAFASSIQSSGAPRTCVTVMAPDGSGRRDVLCPTGSDGSPRQISGLQWFPDGKRLLICTSRANNPSNLRSVDVATGKARLLLSLDHCPERSSIAPDGKRLAFESDKSIFVLDVATGARRLLTTGTSPVFSPDGKAIAFSKEAIANNFHPVFVIDADGGKPRQVSRPNDNDGAYLSHAPLEWSVKGDQILVAEARDYGADFYAYSYVLVRTNDGSVRYLANDREYALNLPNAWFEEEEGAIPLANCVARQNLIGKQGETKLYKLEVPAGTPKLRIATTGGTGDVSLYASLGEAPSPTDAQYWSAHAGSNNETLDIARVTPGTYYIKVVGEQAYGGVNLKACCAP